MTPRTQNEAQELIDKLAQRDTELRHENEEISAYVQVAKGLAIHTRFFVGTIILATLWLGKMQWAQTIHGDELKALMDFRAAALVTQNANQVFDLSIANTVNSNRMERMNSIDNLTTNINRQQALWDTWTVRFSEMWFGRKNGTSNSAE